MESIENRKLGSTKPARVPMDADRQAVVTLLKMIGEDPTREGLQDTPSRFCKAFKELTRGYGQKPHEILARTFGVQCDEMITVSGIEFWSLCEHHLLPFHGYATVSYVPGKRIVGLSKIPRLVLCFANRLQVQEQLTNQIADSMMEHLAPKGVGVSITSLHQCQAMRGVRSNGKMTSTAVRGIIKKDPKARAEFLAEARR